jgi:LacI family repressor for deo operon, udp, cdd, tsx, nupC, and nupG
VAVTLRDVARRAGVSPRTVSNVVNDFPYISPAMRAKVEAALSELNYKPNLLARSLRQGRTGIITLLLPEIAVSYFGELAHVVVECASELGYTVMIDETGGKPGRERALLDAASQSSWVDGVLLSSEGLRGRDLAGLVPGVPVVLLGERTAKTAFDHVGIDNVKAAREAVRHLIGGGRRRIAAVGGSDSMSDTTSRLRLRGYRRELRAAGLPADGLYVPTPDYKRASAAAAVHWLLSRDDPPDGIFCFSDELAVGVLRQLHEHGVRVPADISIAGFDDIDEARFAIPSLTSIRPDKAGIATAAMDTLMQRTQAPQARPRDIRIGYELIVRESSTRSGAE